MTLQVGTLPMCNQEMESDHSKKLCGKKRNCSKISGHSSKCNSKRSFNESFLFNKTKLISNFNREKEGISILQELLKTKETEHLLLLEKIQQKEIEYQSSCEKSTLQSQKNNKLHNAYTKLQLLLNETESEYLILVDKVKQKKIELHNLCENTFIQSQKNDGLLLSYKQVSILFEKKGYAQTRKENVPTDASMIYSNVRSAKYRRRHDSYNVMKYIHGGHRGLIYGCWDLLVTSATSKGMEEFLLSYKRGQFLQKLYCRINAKGAQTEHALKEAVAKKYTAHLSSRKYSLYTQLSKSYY
ncbi:uncharacterized protein LOC124809066 [Hydra vulgaris]|uniref:uncharacterized protein LOC124809066 n=1 Tax=Hydra vulgaris TaxID=6087 RepID=UPI001F5F6A9C|nr:uncharacterized protein LOC124809066 [Hydra vulgaris]